MTEQDELRTLLLEELRLRKKARVKAEDRRQTRKQFLAGAGTALAWVLGTGTLVFAMIWGRP